MKMRMMINILQEIMRADDDINDGCDNSNGLGLV